MQPGDETQHLQPLIAAAEKTLGEVFGSTVQLGQSEVLGGSERSTVLRSRVFEGPAGTPASVIIKNALGDADHPYDPEAAPPFSSAWRLFNDWTGAQFLNDVSAAPPVAPQFYGGDRARGFIILEDLGEGESLADILLGGDPLYAEQALLSFAATLGRMHAATIGREADYRRLRNCVVTDSPASSTQDNPAYPRFCEACDILGIALPTDFRAALEVVCASMREPGPFLAYTHGDACPDNNRYSHGSLCLLDFEFGGFRHALRDGVYGRVPFPTCWCVNRLPADIPPRMEAAYRTELVRGCPEAGDDVIFRKAVVEASAHWVLETTGRHLQDALEEDRDWGIASLRQRVLLRLDRLAALTDEMGYLQPLGAAAREIAVRLRVLWPSEADQIPLYPAFRESDSGAVP